MNLIRTGKCRNMISIDHFAQEKIEVSLTTGIVERKNISYLYVHRNINNYLYAHCDFAWETT